MKLNLSKREKGKKSQLTQIRYGGDIPAVVYRSGQVGKNIIINGHEISSVIRSLKKGHLPTTIFEIELCGKEGSCSALVRDVQYHPTTYQIFHIDLQELEDKKPVNVKVPITFVGVSECVGVKLGGMIRQKIYHVKVRCLPRDIPENFVLDVHSLSIGDSIRVGDIEKGEGVRVLIPNQEIVVTIAKR